MELRVLQYFLAVTREQSISAAAQSLHLSQPTLSRQLKDLEQELGKTLFLRSNRKITLTQEGIILRKRAEEILDLIQKAQNEIELSDQLISGNLYIGAGETETVRLLAQAAQLLQQAHPMVQFHIISGDRTTVLDDLDHGIIDFALVFGKIDTSRYDRLVLPQTDCFGVMMKKDDLLAEKEIITPDDLRNKPLIASRQMILEHYLTQLFECDESELYIAGTYNLLFNGSLMVAEGMGYAICFDKIINVSGSSNLCFRPLSIRLSPEISLIWKKYQLLTKPAEKFLLTLQQHMKDETVFI